MLNTSTLPCRGDKLERSCGFAGGKRGKTSWEVAAAGSGSLSWTGEGWASGWSSCGSGSRACRDQGSRRWGSAGRPWRRRGWAGAGAAATWRTRRTACPTLSEASAKAPPRTCPSPAPRPSSACPSPHRWSPATCPSRAGPSASCSRLVWEGRIPRAASGRYPAKKRVGERMLERRQEVRRLK